MAAAQGRTLRERSVLAEVPASAMIVALDGKPVGFVDIGKLLCGRTGTIAASSGFSPMIPNTAQLREASPECPITPLWGEFWMTVMAHADGELSCPLQCAPSDKNSQKNTVRVRSPPNALAGVQNVLRISCAAVAARVQRTLRRHRITSAMGGRDYS